MHSLGTPHMHSLGTPHMHSAAFVHFYLLILCTPLPQISLTLSRAPLPQINLTWALADHWEREMPGRIMTVHYEHLVSPRGGTACASL